jgi:hypothetical protein
MTKSLKDKTKYKGEKKNQVMWKSQMEYQIKKKKKKKNEDLRAMRHYDPSQNEMAEWPLNKGPNGH